MGHVLKLLKMSDIYIRIHFSILLWYMLENGHNSKLEKTETEAPPHGTEASLTAHSALWEYLLYASISSLTN